MKKTALLMIVVIALSSVSLMSCGRLRNAINSRNTNSNQNQSQPSVVENNDAVNPTQETMATLIPTVTAVQLPTATMEPIKPTSTPSTSEISNDLKSLDAQLSEIEQILNTTNTDVQLP
jgi:hypothetical protein